ncbi:acyltransferase family protein [Actinomadura viridis]|uniref:acyltransferase family protein n=1 Tax=Actinomadura viridis TaxID=58110 RepID=UPI0036A20DED
MATAPSSPGRPSGDAVAGGVPPISGRQGTLDGVRAVAALAVLVYHVASTAGALTAQGGAGWLYNGGQVGVPIFFTLSGLLLYRPWAAAVLEGPRPGPRARTYLRKRASRILPAYWAAVAVFMVTAGLSHVSDLRTWLSLLTLTHTYLPDPWWRSGLGPPHLGQIWSLVVEAAWYLSLPATAAVLAWYARRGRTGGVGARARRLLRAIAVYAAISPVYTVAMFVPEYRPLLGLWLPRFLAWFAIGMALAVVTVWARLEPGGPVARGCATVAASWRTCWAGAALLYVIASTPATGPLDLVTPDVFWTSVLDLVLYGLCAAAFVAPVALAPAGAPGLEAVLGNRVARFLGRISYSLFLWQMLIIVGWYEWTDRQFRGDVATDLPLLLAASIAAATASYVLVERPALRLGRPRASSSPRTPPPDPPPAAGRDATVPGPAGR